METPIITKEQEIDIEAKQRSFGMALARAEGDVVARAKVIAAMDAWEAKLIAKFGATQAKAVLYEDCE